MRSKEGEVVSDNAYIKAKKADEYYRYHLEADIKKYAPAVPKIQTLVAPPKGKYCNDDYKFCPYLLMGGFCTKLGKGLQMLDGHKFTSIPSKQFWDSLGEKSIKAHNHNVAVGAYRVFKKRCNDSQSEQLSMF
jgi:hypothetical protein